MTETDAEDRAGDPGDGDADGEASGGTDGEPSRGADGDATGNATESDDLAERVETWLAKQMPIIQMHGGTSNVRKADPEDGEVVIELGGGCAGCSFGDVTAGNIEQDLLEWEEVEEVTVRVPDDGEGFGVDQSVSQMGIDRTEGGRGDFKDGRWS